jgi:hypothetical protein
MGKLRMRAERRRPWGLALMKSILTMKGTPRTTSSISIRIIPMLNTIGTP